MSNQIDTAIDPYGDQHLVRSQGAAVRLFSDDIPRRGTALGRPPVSLFALARTGYGPLRRRILGTVVWQKSADLGSRDAGQK